jgi:uncharacterized membrane protein
MTIFIIILALLALPFIAALFIRKEYKIERAVTIDKPNSEVFDYVRHLKNQENFSKWVMIDPTAKKEYSGTDGTTGFIYAWDSKNKNAGKGEQEIKNIIDGKKVDIEVRFERPFTNTAQTPFVTDSISGNQTQVRWGMFGKNKYPMNLMNPFISNLLGKDMETSLGTLKTILEK